LDIAPTLLDLAGYDIPDVMQGRSLRYRTQSLKPAEAGGSQAL
jgi:hypothetical protein